MTLRRKRKLLIHLIEKARNNPGSIHDWIQRFNDIISTWFLSSSWLFSTELASSLASHYGPWQLHDHNLPGWSLTGLFWLTYTALNHCSLRLTLNSDWIVNFSPTANFLLFSYEYILTNTDFDTRKSGTTEEKKNTGFIEDKGYRTERTLLFPLHFFLEIL